MRDLNAKVGIHKSGYEESFAILYAVDSLVIGGTIFAHKRIHKAT